MIEIVLISTTVVASTVFIWDYMLTFRMELDLVWKSKWTFMKAMYIFQSYLPFVDMVGLVLYTGQSDSSYILLT